MTVRPPFILRGIGMSQSSVDFLAAGIFGSSTMLRSDVETFHAGIAEIVSYITSVDVPRKVPSPALNACAWRSALEGSFKMLQDGASRQHVADVLNGTPAVSLHAGKALTAGQTATQLRLLTGDDLGDPRTQLLLAKYHQALAIPPAAALAATADMQQSLQDAVSLLKQVLGELATGTLEGVHAAFVFDPGQPVESAFLADAPGLIALNANLLNDTVALADAVLHESAHQKSYDLMAVRQIVLISPRIRYEIPWNPILGVRRSMDALRILSALHVYVHLLTLLRGVVAANLDPQGAYVGRLRDYWRRARFFACVAEQGGLGAGLSKHGQEMAAWLVECFYVIARELETFGIGIDHYWDVEAELQLRSWRRRP